MVVTAAAVAGDPEPLLSIDQLARWLNKPKATLYAWRTRPRGPPAIRLGTTLRYRRDDVERWLDGYADQRSTPIDRHTEYRTASRGSAQDTDRISPATPIDRLGSIWIDEITRERRVTGQTISYYQRILRGVVVPALGDMLIADMTVGRIDRFLKDIAAYRPAQARGAKVVLGQMLAMAARHEALTGNPVRDTSRLRQPPRHVKALTTEDLKTVRAAIRDWQTATPGKPGPHHTSDLSDVVDLLLATGARIGEVLALRWCDIDLTMPATPTLTICGTLVYLKGKGVFRQPWTKSTAGYRTLILPRFAVHMLRQRHTRNPDGDPVFQSRRGTWLAPWNVRRQWREARKDTGLTWVTPHTFRKTVATLLDREASTSAAASQLGHASEAITTMYYVEKSAIAPDVSDILQTLDGNSAMPMNAT
jgi:integrase